MLYSMNIKSPLRYPGGKSRAIKQILPIVPSFDEYREPMVGGGSVFFALFQKYPNKKYWINDINRDLYIFKGITAKKLFEMHPEIRSRLWNGHLWNPSYYVGTCGDTTKETVKMYIETQKVK